jgi:hypothetical protein
MNDNLAVTFNPANRIDGDFSWFGHFCISLIKVQHFVWKNRSSSQKDRFKAVSQGFWRRWTARNIGVNRYNLIPGSTWSSRIGSSYAQDDP